MMHFENQPSRSGLMNPRIYPINSEKSDATHARLVFAAVLFADIKGFTRFCQSVDPCVAFHTLSTFHQRMAEVVAEYSTTVTTNAGDEVMAAWCGTPSAVSSTALRCGFAMLESIDAWNREDVSLRPGLNIGVGLHAGPVILGRIPGLRESRMSVFGDTVNTASRLEHMTRIYPTDLIASDELVRVVCKHSLSETGINRLHSAITTTIRDRTGLLSIRIAI